MQKTGFIKVVIIIAITAIIGGVAGYFIFNKNKDVAEEEISKKVEVRGETTGLKTYQNDKFEFEFQYPAHWTISREVGKKGVYREPYLFDVVVETEAHSINRAGHISVMNMSFGETVEEIETMFKLQNQASNLENFSSNNLQGKKFKLEFSNSTQIDYGYVLDFDGDIIYITFSSFSETEKNIPEELLEDIDRFVQTFRKIIKN